MAESDEKAKNLSKFPKFGWKVKLDHKFPETRDQFLKPTPSQVIPQLVPLGIRYLKWWTGKVRAHKKPVIDQFRPCHSKMMYGAPCGGLGSGTIGRGFRGEFCRFQMVPGIYEYNTVPSDQFIVSIHNSKGDCLYQSVLGGKGQRPKGAPSSWEWLGKPEDSLYCALYPRAWTVYNIPEVGVRIICRQISPFVPKNYKESCLPTTVFVFSVENNSDKDLRVGITFTFKNGTGSKKDRLGGVWTEPFSQPNSRGVVIHQQIRNQTLNYCIAAKQSNDSHVSWCSAFDPRGTGEQVWEPLKGVGLLDSAKTITQKTRKGEEVAAAVSSRISVSKHESKNLEICLSWDNPKIRFGNGKKEHVRYYTRYFGANAEAGPAICEHALTSFSEWETLIEAWQEPTLADKNLPDWYKSAIFNELYFIADGGSVWLETDDGERFKDSDLRKEYGRWGYLESHEYRMYNTYDVHYYASWALIDLFPGLQISLQLDMLDWSDKEDKELVTELYGGKRNFRKVAFAVPHDLGDPEEEPWVKVNSYTIHDVSEWKDLNLKMIIQIWRDIMWINAKEGKQLLDRALPTCTKLMEQALTWDLDNDGLIENGGKPDQTFDSWVMTGPSAYCGGLWLAALACMADMCDRAELVSDWRNRLAVAEKAYVAKLWNGKFFNFDKSSRGDKVIMADQLAGYWYRKLQSINEDQPFLDKDKVRTSLKTIFENNVMKFCGGNMGAVNGMMVSGDIDRSTVQSEEVWTGVTYGLASLMLCEGMKDEGFKTAEGVYKTVYETIGLGFETPEALYEKKHYRAIGYMRPLSIWAMNIALGRRHLE
eukprot:TRINITY_DN10747_c0_g1_i1.p1 TRINITY_DN10747_c0_g1~~TRINITY_DN10747_c0_g1_i1.p1  ORF type:complete len:818 (-),score=118.10 TRINITY_DN10747_c0_g1_i1:399-2852(-)